MSKNVVVPDFLKKSVKRLPRQARHEAMKYLQHPIRMLGGCLICGVPTVNEPHPCVGIYVPQDGSPISQFVVYVFCEDHMNDSRRFDAASVEQLVAQACADRPHVYLVLGVMPNRKTHAYTWRRALVFMLAVTVALWVIFFAVAGLF